MTPELETLKRLHEAATPEPWDKRECLSARNRCMIETEDRIVAEWCSTSDTELTVALRNLAPELIALLEAVEKMEHYPYGKEHEHPEFQEMWEAFFNLRAKLREVKP